MRSRRENDDSFFDADSYPRARMRKLVREKRRQRIKLSAGTKRWRNAPDEADPDMRPDRQAVYPRRPAGARDKHRD